MMEGWRECKLGDVVTLQRGFDITKSQQCHGTYPVVSSSGIKSYHSACIVNGPGVVIGRKGTLGSVFYLEKSFWPHDTTLWVKNFFENNPRFIYYFFKFLEFENYDVGSSNPTLNRNHIHLLPVYVPCYDEQQAIAAVLSSLDDKIDLLHRQNKTLEAMAQTLFRQWFVEEADDGWEELSVGGIAIHSKVGITPGADKLTEFYHYSIPAYDDGQEPVLEMGSSIMSNKYKVAPNSILVSKLNPRTPRIWPIRSILSQASVCSTEFQVVVPKDNDFFEFTYCLLCSREAQESLMMAASGTSGSHQRVKPEDIFAISLKMQSKDKIGLFSQQVRPYFEQKFSNQKQIRTLSKLRNTLLPKLMSGEVGVEV